MFVCASGFGFRDFGVLVRGWEDEVEPPRPHDSIDRCLSDGQFEY